MEKIICKHPQCGRDITEQVEEMLADRIALQQKTWRIKGGKARAQVLTPERRAEIARKGGEARKTAMELKRFNHLK